MNMKENIQKHFFKLIFVGDIANLIGNFDGMWNLLYYK